MANSLSSCVGTWDADCLRKTDSVNAPKFSKGLNVRLHTVIFSHMDKTYFKDNYNWSYISDTFQKSYYKSLIYIMYIYDLALTKLTFIL